MKNIIKNRIIKKLIAIILLLIILFGLLPSKNQVVHATTDIFNENITFSEEYKTEDGIIPYALYTPSTASNRRKMPLIVWLHGGGEVGQTEEVFKTKTYRYAIHSKKYRTIWF